MDDFQKERLEDAFGKIWNASHTLEDLKDVAGEADASELTQAHSDVQSALEQLREVVEKYDLDPDPLP